jgi:predicted amidohydrolase
MHDLRAVPSGTITVAAGQAACTARDIPANVPITADLVRRAADQGAELLVLPELFLTGYELQAIVADPQTYTVSPADTRLDPLAIACAETRTAVAVGAPTRGTEGLHISALVLRRDGRFAAQYDKQHVDPAERAAGFRPGASGSRSDRGSGWNPTLSAATATDGCATCGAMTAR